jgi:hypothetical protein
MGALDIVSQSNSIIEIMHCFIIYLTELLPVDKFPDENVGEYDSYGDDEHHLAMD